MNRNKICNRILQQSKGFILITQFFPLGYLIHLQSYNE